MRRPMRLLAFLLASLVAVPGVVVAEDDGEGRGKGREKSDPRGPRLGGFASVVDGSVAGEHVSFDWNATGLSRYAVGGAVLFDVEAPGAPDRPGSGPRAAGVQLVVAGGTYRAQAHDNPLAALKFESDDAIVVRLASGANATAAGENHYVVDFGTHRGRFFGESLRAAGSTLVGEERVHFLLDAPVSPVDTARGAIARATGDRKVGAEVSMAADERHDVLAYGAVKASVVRAPSAKGDLVLRIEGHGFEGRVVVLNLDGRLFGEARADRLEAFFDNETMRRAEGGLPDALDPDDDGLAPEYWIGQDVETGALQMVVSVPHYSVHEVRVASILAEAPVSIVAGVALGVVAIAASAFFLFRRPSD